MQVNASRVVVIPNISRTFHIRLGEVIGDTYDFEEEFTILANAGPEDHVIFDLMTPGGNLLTTMLLIRAIKECQAITTARIGMLCASGGTAIALACDRFEVDEYSCFMVHTASTASAYGKLRDAVADMKTQQAIIERWVKNTYKDFLTEDEMERVLESRDLYFEGDELIERLNRHLQARKALAETEEDE